MPKFHEIFSTVDTPFRIKNRWGVVALVSGATAIWENSATEVTPIALATEDWTLVPKEPTAEDIFKAAGIRATTEGVATGRKVFETEPRVGHGARIYCDKKPITPDLARKIVEVLEALK